ncbi:MAG: hypothetical protein R3C45_05110 [Phycisphaerales bacterium]
MSKRERILVWAVAMVIGFFVLDRFVITPLQTHLSQLAVDADAVDQEISEARVLIDNRELIETRWAGRVGAGLGLDPASARLGVQGQLSEFAEASGLSLTNLSAGGDLKSDPYTEVRFSLTGTGELRQVVRFLKHVQEASIPLAVQTCDVSRRDDNGGRLTLRLTVSTLVYSGKEAGL